MPKYNPSNIKKQSKTLRSVNARKENPVEKQTDDQPQESNMNFGFSNLCVFEDDNTQLTTANKDKSKTAPKVPTRADKKVNLKPTRREKLQSPASIKKDAKKVEDTKIINKKTEKKVKTKESKPKVATRSRSVSRPTDTKKITAEIRKDTNRSRSRSVVPKAIDVKSKVKIEESNEPIIKSESVVVKYDARNSKKPAKKPTVNLVDIKRKGLPEQKKKIKKQSKEFCENKVEKAPRRSTLKAIEKIQIGAAERHPRSTIKQTSTSLNRKEVKSKLNKASKKVASAYYKLKEPLPKETEPEVQAAPVETGRTPRRSEAKAANNKKTVEAPKPIKRTDNKENASKVMKNEPKIKSNEKPKKKVVEVVVQHKLKKTANKNSSKDQKKETLKDTFENENRDIKRELEKNLFDLKSKDKSKSPVDGKASKKEEKKCQFIKLSKEEQLLMEKEEGKLQRHFQKNKRAERMRHRVEESDGKKSPTIDTLISNTKESTKPVTMTRRSKKLSPTKAFANPTVTNKKAPKVPATKAFANPTIASVASNNVPV